MSKSANRASDPFDRVWQKIRYGRRYSDLFDLARDIKSLHPLFQRTMRTQLGPSENRLVNATAMSLLKAAVASSKQLREVAAALDAETRKDPFQVNILRAYQDCTDDPEQPPTLADVRNAFVKRFSRDWRVACDNDLSGKSDFSVRKTLRMLGLPLANARRGRPAGARSLIGNRKQ